MSNSFLDFSYIGETKRSFSIRKKELLSRHSAPTIRLVSTRQASMFLTANIPWIGPTLKYWTSYLTTQNAGLSSRISLTKFPTL